MSQTAKQIYLDYAAGTPCRPEVVTAMQPFFAEQFSNPSSIHRGGVATKKILTSSREEIALHFGVKKEELYFVSGGTESTNTAILGVGRFFLTDDTFKGKPHIITSTIEHPAVLEPVAQLAREGCEVSYVSPNNKGIITPESVEKVLTKNTVLVSIALVNGEIGTIQPIRKITKTALSFKEKNNREVDSYPFVHTDAAQAPLVMSIKQEKFLVDMMSLDASKMYGPKFGLLCKKKYVPLQSLLFGGSQEKHLRPGTENLPYIVGTAKALAVAQAESETFAKEMFALKTFFINEILEALPKAFVNGTCSGKESSSLISNICFAAYDVNAEFLVLQLDAKNIAVSAMTACKSLDDTAFSYVVSEVSDLHKTNSQQNDCANASIRFSFGVNTTKKDLSIVVQKLKELL